MFDQQQIIEFIEELIPDIRNNPEPEPALVKFAQKKNLPPAVLEKLAQTYNTAKTLNYLDKAPNGKRGESFNIVDPQRVVSAYIGEGGEQEGKGSVPASDPWYEALKPGTEITISIKAASADNADIGEVKDGGIFPHMYNFDNWDLDTQELVRSVDDWYFSLKKAYELKREEMEAKREYEIYGELQYEDEKRYRSSLEKIANTFREKYWIDYAAFEKDACRALVDNKIPEDAAIETLNKIAKYMTNHHIRIKRASELNPGKRRLLNDEHGLLSAVLEAHDARVCLGVIKEAREKLANSAILNPPASATEMDLWREALREERDSFNRAERERQRREDQEIRERQREEDLAERREREEMAREDKAVFESQRDYKERDSEIARRNEEFDRYITEGITSGIEGANQAWTSGVIRPGFGLIGKVFNPYPAINEKQKEIDTQFSNEKSDIVFNTLMLTDPILSEADEDQLREIYETIRDVAPNISKDPVKLRVVLREAAEMDGINPFSLKSLADIENIQLQNRRSQGEREANLYKINPLPVV